MSSSQSMSLASKSSAYCSRPRSRSHAEALADIVNTGFKRRTVWQYCRHPQAARTALQPVVGLLAVEDGAQFAQVGVGAADPLHVILPLPRGGLGDCVAG